MEIESSVVTNLLTTKEAAAMLKMSPRTLEHWREIGGGPPFLKVGRAVRYEHHAIGGYLAGRSCQNTSEARVASQGGVIAGHRRRSSR